MPVVEGLTVVEETLLLLDSVVSTLLEEVVVDADVAVVEGVVTFGVVVEDGLALEDSWLLLLFAGGVGVGVTREDGGVAIKRCVSQPYEHQIQVDATYSLEGQVPAASGSEKVLQGD